MRAFAALVLFLLARVAWAVDAADRISVYVSVQTADGAPAGALTTNDLVVEHDKKVPAQVTEVAPAQDVPIRMGVILDTSYPLLLPEIEQNLNAFYRRALRQGRDQVWVFRMGKQGSNMTTAVDPRYSDAGTFQASLGEALNTHAGEDFIDVMKAFLKEAEAAKGAGPVRRVFIVVNAAGLFIGESALPKLVDFANLNQITFHCISLDESFKRLGLAVLNIGRFQDLAERTGGIYSRDHEQGPIEVERYLRSQYRLSFAPEGRRDNKLHPLEVRTPPVQKLRVMHPQSFAATK